MRLFNLNNASNKGQPMKKKPTFVTLNMKEKSEANSAIETVSHPRLMILIITFSFELIMRRLMTLSTKYLYSAFAHFHSHCLQHLLQISAKNGSSAT